MSSTEQMGVVKAHEHWGVTVDTFGEQIVRIETEYLSGREISDVDESTIRRAAEHLLAFIGDPYPAALSPDVATAARVPLGAVEALASYQQGDMDGTMVLVSRQALDECLPALRALAGEEG